MELEELNHPDGSAVICRLVESRWKLLVFRVGSSRRQRRTRHLGHSDVGLDERK